jgi:hypothetical protein
MWSRSQARRLVVCALAICASLSFIAHAASAAETELWAAPGRISESELQRLWVEAEDLELAAHEAERTSPERAIALYRQAGDAFARLAELRADPAKAHWRSARAVWLAGDTLPLDDVDGRIEHFELTLVRADRGIQADPECAECMLWKFIGMGRLGTTRGVWTAMQQASEMAELLDRAIELQPTHRDGEHNSTLGNLHYSSAIFYRVMPDWFWLSWVMGVRGDKERALVHSRKAVALHPSRLDYQVELGAQLLCMGSLERDATRLAEGRNVMGHAMKREPKSQDDAREISFARIMVKEPERSCGYSGDKLLEMDEDNARKQASGA